jgi:hypothetical protein
VINIEEQEINKSHSAELNMSTSKQTNECSDIIDMKVDVGVLKTQISVISQLCEKMDKVIEKLVDAQDRHISQVYREMDKRRIETDADVKEIHSRIDTVLDKVQDTERRLLEEIKGLRTEISDHNRKEKESLDKLLEWKWMVAGGIIVMSWLISHLSLDTIKSVLFRM